MGEDYQSLLEYRRVSQTYESSNRLDFSLAWTHFHAVAAQPDRLELLAQAERRAGEILREMEKHPRHRYRDAGRCMMQPPTLQDLGIDYHQSHRWQTEASVPERHRSTGARLELFQTSVETGFLHRRMETCGDRGPDA